MLLLTGKEGNDRRPFFIQNNQATGIKASGKDSGSGGFRGGEGAPKDSRASDAYGTQGTLTMMARYEQNIFMNIVVVVIAFFGLNTDFYDPGPLSSVLSLPERYTHSHRLTIQNLSTQYLRNRQLSVKGQTASVLTG